MCMSFLYKLVSNDPDTIRFLHALFSYDTYFIYASEILIRMTVLFILIVFPL